MLVVNRFQVPEPEQDTFRAGVEQALSVLRARPGFQSGEFVRNLDEPELWALVTSWRDVGSYRRALQGMESKMVVVPLLSRALDEASAYDAPDEVGPNLPRIN